MPRFARPLIAAALLCAPLAVHAETVPPAPAATPAAPDPARIAAARITVDRVFPTGTYARVMDKALDGVTRQAIDAAGTLPMRELAGIGGASPEDLAKMGPATLADIMVILDPAYHERTERGLKVMKEEMAAMMGRLEPDMREGLVEAYAARFTLPQLEELNRFFATPTGSEYAAQSMLLFMDPAVMQRMQAAMPEIMRQMPAMMRKMQTATADLPPPRRYDDLSPKERARLAELLGTSAAELDARHKGKGR